MSRSQTKGSRSKRKYQENRHTHMGLGGTQLCGTSGWKEATLRLGKTHFGVGRDLVLWLGETSTLNTTLTINSTSTQHLHHFNIQQHLDPQRHLYTSTSPQQHLDIINTSTFNVTSILNTPTPRHSDQGMSNVRMLRICEVLPIGSFINRQLRVVI